MKIDRVTYKKKFPTGLYLNEDIGFEASIEHGEYVLGAIEKLRELAEQSHKNQYPHLYTQNGKPITIEQVPETQVDKGTPKERQIANIAAQIGTCQEIRVLESYKLIVKAHPELQPIYDNKLKELQ